MTPTQASEKYYWCRFDKDTNTIELYLDNFSLSGSRMCESHFYLNHLLGIQPKYTNVGTRDDGKIIRKPWFFDFGEYIHWCLEQFYRHFKIHKSAPIVDTWLVLCKKMWLAMKMDDYANSVVEADQTKYHDIKGWEGVAGLLIQYYAYYMDMRFRVVDTEITFGFGKEVHIGDFVCHTDDKSSNAFNTVVNCYLTGRIDVLVDNGYKIGPIDHKTTHKFDGFEHDDFNPHDGICGYILAIHDIISKYREQGLTNLPSCNGGWINHISACTPSTPRDKSKKQGPRFKTTPIDKSNEQLEDYKARQLSTFKRIAELLFNDKTPEWDTMMCNNMFHRKCPYKPIHEQPSSQWARIIQDHYIIGEFWDTRKTEKDAKTVGE